MNRKGSLQLSINAIVILIMAIALLGVGIFFINNVVGGVLEQPEQISEQLKQQLLQQLRESGTKFLISGIGEDGVVVPLGKSKDIVLAVNNKEDVPINVKFDITDKDLGLNSDTTAIYDSDSAYYIEPTESILLPVRFNDIGIARGEEIWLIEVKYCLATTGACTVGNDIYASQSVFVSVK